MSERAAHSELALVFERLLHELQHAVLLLELEALREHRLSDRSGRLRGALELRELLLPALHVLRKRVRELLLSSTTSSSTSSTTSDTTSSRERSGGMDRVVELLGGRGAREAEQCSERRVGIRVRALE